jgi:HK97 family phage major capsid protein
MGVYLDRLTAEYDEILSGTDELLERAAAENRELNADETKTVERDNERAEELRKSIEYHAGVEESRSKVAALRSKFTPAPSRQGTTNVIVTEREKDPDVVLREAFPTVGDYIVTAGRALRGDAAALEMIERATAHQTTADNPGIIPRPILEPVVNLIDNNRPFVQSVARRPLTAQAFDRPVVTQHVAVGKQAAEKDPTASQKMIIGKLPVAAGTFAGHLNISRQDIKWSQPGIMQIVAEDFANIYAQETDEDAVTQFVASLTNNSGVPVADWDAATIRKILFTAAGAPLTAGKPLGFPDTFWMSVDVWATFGGDVGPMGVPSWPGLDPGSFGGSMAGFKVVVDPYFAPNTGIIGRGSLVEFYEDLDGFLSVDEPDVLGQLVGYAGYTAELNTAPDVFSVLTLPAPVLDAEGIVSDARAAAKSK